MKSAIFQKIIKEFLVELNNKSISQNLLDRDGLLPKVSVVMPSFNQKEYIERSLLSLINQCYPKLEIIVIDGGSTDGTIEIIKKFESYITYWISEPDRGQSDALNKGFAIATGDIYGWLNSDDIYMPDALNIAVETFQQNPQKGIVFGDWLSIDKHDNVLEYEYAFPLNNWHSIYEGVSINTQAMFWRREVHFRFGDFDVSLFNTMDYQLVIALGLREGHNAFVFLPVVLGCFRRYEGQKTGKGNHQRQLREHLYLARRYGYTEKYKFIGKIRRMAFRIRRAYWYLNRAGLSYTLKKIVGSFQVRQLNFKL